LKLEKYRYHCFLITFQFSGSKQTSCLSQTPHPFLQTYMDPVFEAHSFFRFFSSIRFSLRVNSFSDHPNVFLAYMSSFLFSIALPLRLGVPVFHLSPNCIFYGLFKLCIPPGRCKAVATVLFSLAYNSFCFLLIFPLFRGLTSSSRSPCYILPKKHWPDHGPRPPFCTLRIPATFLHAPPH